MYRFTEIKLADKEYINTLRKKYRQSLAFYNFASLYMWSRELKLTLCKKEECFIIKESGLADNVYYFPCGSEEEKAAFISYALKKHNNSLILGYLRNKDKDFLEEYFPGQFQIREDRDNYEYIYSVQEQTSLSGTKFKCIRKEINKANRNLDLSWEMINEENLSEVKKITLDWNRLYGGNKKMYFGDTAPCLYALDAFFELGLFGVLVRNREEACAYVIGSEMMKSTVDIHMAKSSKLIKNLDACSKKFFYENLLGKYKYVNREDDMGLEGLRLKKLSQQPIKLAKVWKGVTF